MADNPETKKYTLPDYAVDVLVKGELRRTAAYEAESSERLGYIKDDVKMRKENLRIYGLMFKVIVYQSILFTAAFLWLVLK